MKYILVVDDEKDLKELVRHHLRKAGFDAEGFSDAESAYTRVHADPPGAIVLDLVLPGRMQGTELCRFLRSHERTERIPALILTGRTEESDKLLAFEMGADDYMTKPYRVYSRDQILESVWGFNTRVKPRTVDVHIQKLRQHIEEDPTNPRRIVTVRGVGYKFVPDAPPPRNNTIPQFE